MSSSEDHLVTVVTKATEFEAEAVVAVLHDAGIEAVAMGGQRAALPLPGKLFSVPVMVRQADLENAQKALAQNVADSVDLDWDEVDVGEREDELPLGHRDRMPALAFMGLILAGVLAVGMVALGVLAALSLL